MRRVRVTGQKGQAGRPQGCARGAAHPVEDQQGVLGQQVGHPPLGGEGTHGGPGHADRPLLVEQRGGHFGVGPQRDLAGPDHLRQGRAVLDELVGADRAATGGDPQREPGAYRTEPDEGVFEWKHVLT
jgi:hypothetical protein